MEYYHKVDLAANFLCTVCLFPFSGPSVPSALEIVSSANGVLVYVVTNHSFPAPSNIQVDMCLIPEQVKLHYSGYSY